MPRSPKLVAFPHPKGGTGSTSIVRDLGTALAARRHPTLLVDLDPLCALSFSILDDAPARTIADCLDGRARLEEIAVETSQKRLWLAPGSARLQAWDRKPERLSVDLARVLRQTPEEIEAVLLDLPAGMGVIVRTALALIPGGRLVAVLQPRPMDLAGLADLFGLVEDLRDRNPDLAVRAIVATRTNRSALCRDVLDALRREHGPRLFPTVRESSLIARAPLRHRSVVETNPASGATEDVLALARAFVAMVLRD